MCLGKTEFSLSPIVLTVSICLLEIRLKNEIYYYQNHERKIQQTLLVNANYIIALKCSSLCGAYCKYPICANMFIYTFEAM